MVDPLQIGLGFLCGTSVFLTCGFGCYRLCKKEIEKVDPLEDGSGNPAAAKKHVPGKAGQNPLLQQVLSLKNDKHMADFKRSSQGSIASSSRSSFLTAESSQSYPRKSSGISFKAIAT